MPDEVSDIFSTANCDQPSEAPSEQTTPNRTKPPLIDIFLNPNPKVVERKLRLISRTSNISIEYFKTVNMTTLYPELFKGRFHFKVLEEWL